jgi:membrane protease YdiL (CAAX protease family)
MVIDAACTAVEVALAFGAATAIVAGLYHVQSVGFVHNNLHALVAVLFLLSPRLILRSRADIADYGFTLGRAHVGLLVFAVVAAIVLPLFVGGFFAWTRFACTHLPQLVPGACAHALHPRLRWPPDFKAVYVAAQVIVIALPEEHFFRGYLQGRLEDAWPPRWRLFGARVGGAWLVSAALFGLGHFLVTLEPQMLTRFFPGLVFGWMYARTRSILASTLFHATCNLLMDVLVTSFYT